MTRRELNQARRRTGGLTWTQPPKFGKERKEPPAPAAPPQLPFLQSPPTTERTKLDAWLSKIDLKPGLCTKEVYAQAKRLSLPPLAADHAIARIVQAGKAKVERRKRHDYLLPLTAQTSTSARPTSPAAPHKPDLPAELLDERRVHDLEDAHALDEIVSEIAFRLKLATDAARALHSVHHEFQQRVHRSMENGIAKRRLEDMVAEMKALDATLATALRMSAFIQSNVNELERESQRLFGSIRGTDREHPAVTELMKHWLEPRKRTPEERA